MTVALREHASLAIRQRHELGEILLSLETRNKYEILDARGAPVAFAAEQGKGLLGLLLRQFLGHWRPFEIQLFTASREPWLVAVHPFRWFFQRLEIRRTGDGAYLGVLQQRFAILSKRFDLQGPDGRVLLEVSSPLWRFWTFPFREPGSTRERAVLRKRWSGGFSELFTDRDTFVVEFTDPELGEEERALCLAAGIFVDLLYFERKS